MQACRTERIRLRDSAEASSNSRTRDSCRNQCLILSVRLDVSVERCGGGVYRTRDHHGAGVVRNVVQNAGADGAMTLECVLFECLWEGNV